MPTTNSLVSSEERVGGGLRLMGELAPHPIIDSGIC